MIELQQSSALKTFCIFRVRYMTGRRKRSCGELLCLSNVKFRFVLRSRRKSILCSRGISLKRRQIVTRTFARTFLESSCEQRTKFVHFACVTFAQYCITKSCFLKMTLCTRTAYMNINYSTTLNRFCILFM